MKDKPTVVIKPPSLMSAIRWREIVEYRELLYFLIWKDIKVRYKQTVLGASWAIIQPFCTMVVFSIFFGRLGKIPSDGVAYPLFSFAALVPWAFFSNGLSRATTSMVSNSNLIKKVYFPRIIMPVAAVLGGIVDFSLAFLTLLGMMFFYYGVSPTANIVWLPALLLLAFITALGVGIWLAVLNVQFRDVSYVVPFIINFWMFASPVAYPSSMMDEKWQTLYALNPMAGVIEGFRWALLGTDTAPGSMIMVSTIISVLMLIGGISYFRRMESYFADVV